MATRSLNKVSLIGNLTRDPELRYTPSGTPVCSFGLATNRSWVTSGSDERQEETEFHNIVAWSKLGELCSQLLSKGRKVYIEGRLQTRSWETPEGQKRTKTEIVAEDMIILDSRKSEGEKPEEIAAKPQVPSDTRDLTSDQSSSQPSLDEDQVTGARETDVKEKEDDAEKPEPGETGDDDKNSGENEEIDIDKIPF